MSKSQVYKYSYFQGEKIIETDEGKFLVIPRCNDKEKIFHYLEQRDFPFFLPMNNSIRDEYEIYPYVVDNMDNSDKAIDLIHILSLLHIKTTSYQEVVLDRVKEIYEQLSFKIEDQMKYYQKLQDEIESHVYMAPDEYLLIRNISLVYENLNFSKHYLEEWYRLKKESGKERVVFLHRQPALDNFIDIKTPYFIHWDLSEKGYPIYDFLYFFKRHYQELEMDSLFKIYQSKFQFTNDEMCLFFSLLLCDDKIELLDNPYQSTISVEHKILYALRSKEFILKQNHKNQETDESKFD